MNWESKPEICSTTGRTIEEQLSERGRRQDLNGFEPVYSDIVDYILRCTHRIWEEKNVGLCRTHYADNCSLHTLAGPTVGAEAVVQATIGTLGSYTDRIVVGEDVIWSEDEPGLFLTSHRITSDGTHLGDDPVIGSASMRQSCGVTTIADCHVRENRIVEEWLVRDNLRGVVQFGLDPWDVARRQSEADQEGDPARHDWRSKWISDVRSSELSDMPPPDHPAAAPAKAYALAFNSDLYGEAAHTYSPTVEVRWPSGRKGYGRGFWIGCLQQIRSALHRAAFRVDHWAARPLPNGYIAVALRWSFVGTHAGSGIWGQPSQKDILVLGISHFKVRADVVVEEITVFDELSVLRQVLGGLGA